MIKSKNKTQKLSTNVHLQNSVCEYMYTEKTAHYSFSFTSPPCYNHKIYDALQCNNFPQVATAIFICGYICAYF